MDDVISQWGKYRIRRLIAKGGMAEVFEAEITGPAGFAKPVCLKRVRPELTANEEFVKMFEAEARIAARLHHTNIVSVFDFDQHDGQMFLTMEYVEGCDLKQVIDESCRLGFRVPVGFAVHVMDGLLSALDHAHTRQTDGRPQPVIHRDVSPHNVLISSDGIIKLADFGIAKSRGLSNETQVGVIKGKLAYFAPEQVSGNASPSSDIFSAGLVLHETLTGKRLFHSEDGAGLVVQLAAFQYTPIPWVSEKLNGYLAILLAADPANRFESAEAARTALRATGIAPMSEREAADLVQSAVRLKKQRLEEEKRAAEAAAPRLSLLETHFATSPSVPPIKSGSNAVKSIDNSQIPKKRRKVGPVFAATAFILAVVIGVLAVMKSNRREQSPDSTESGGPFTPTVSSGHAANRSSPATFSLDTKNIPLATPRNPTLEAPASLNKTGENPVTASISESKIIRLEAPSFEKPSVANRPATALRTAEEDTSLKKGLLEVNVRPWADVWVDGSPKGTTPIKDLPLKAGRHKVRIENKAIGFSEEVKVQIRAGKPTIINREIRKQTRQE